MILSVSLGEYDVLASISGSLGPGVLSASCLSPPGCVRWAEKDTVGAGVKAAEGWVGAAELGSWSGAAELGSWSGAAECGSWFGAAEQEGWFGCVEHETWFGAVQEFSPA